MEDIVIQMIGERKDLVERLREYEDFLRSTESSAKNNEEKSAYIRARINLYRFAYELIGNEQAEEIRQHLLTKYKAETKRDNPEDSLSCDIFPELKRNITF